MPDSPLVSAAAVAVIALAIAVVIAVGLKVLRSFRDLGTDAERATYKTLHAASRAGQNLRTGLNPAGAGKASRQLRGLLGCDGFAITDTTGVLAWDGAAEELRPVLMEVAASVLAGGHTAVIPAGELRAPGGRSPAGAPGSGYAAVIAPIRVGSGVAGVVAAFWADASVTTAHRMTNGRKKLRIIRPLITKARCARRRLVCVSLRVFSSCLRAFVLS